MKSICLSILCLIGATALAQDRTGEVPATKPSNTATYSKISLTERSPVPYPTIREADVMYAQRIERIMDVREKQNLPCRWPNSAFVDIIFNAADRGELTAYKDMSFQSSYRSDSIIAMFATEEVTQKPDTMFPGEWVSCVVQSPYPLEDVVRWKIIEDWIYDKQSGLMKPRIVAIAPIMNLRAEGIDLGEYEGFYINWQEARQLLIQSEFFNRDNDASRYSYYDFFEQRHFASYITKKPNVFDESFADMDDMMDNPLQQLLEAEKAEEERRNFESDLWQY